MGHTLGRDEPIAPLPQWAQSFFVLELNFISSLMFGVGGGRKGGKRLGRFLVA